MKKLRLLACTAALILIATSVFEVTVDESGITTNNRGGRRLALRDHVLRRLRIVATWRIDDIGFSHQVGVSCLLAAEQCVPECVPEGVPESVPGMCAVKRIVYYSRPPPPHR